MMLSMIIGCMCTQTVPLTMLTVTKSAEWCSISMHGCGSVSMVIGVYLAVAAGALLQRWLYNKCFQKNGRKE